MSSPGPSATGRRTVPTRVKVMIGCAVALVLAGTAVGLLSVYWLTTPGRQVSTLTVVGPASTGTMRAGNLAADAGAREFLAAFLRESNRADSGMPPWVKQILGTVHAEGFRQWLPTEATLSLEDSGAGQVRRVGAVNFRSQVRMWRHMLEFMARDPKVGRKVLHRGETLLVLGSDRAVCFVGGTLFFSDSLEQLRAAIDRTLDAGPSPPAVPPGLRDLQGAWDICGAGTGPAATLIVAAVMIERNHELEQVQYGEVPSPVSARFGFDAQAPDGLRGFLELSFADAEQAARAVKAVTDAADRRWSGLGVWYGARVQTSTRQEGEKILVDLQGNGVAAALGRVTAKVTPPPPPPSR